MKNRLRQFIEYTGVNNYTFEKKIGTSEGTIRRFFGDKNGLTVSTLSKISDFYPELNLDWLITGRGDMLFDEEQKQPKNPPQPIDGRLILALANKISDLSREIGQLQAENTDLKNKIARDESRSAAFATAAAG